MKRLVLMLALCGAAATAQTKDNGAQIVNPFRGVMQDRSFHSPDEALFVEKCGMCHRQMGMGTVLLARRMAPTLARLEDRDDLTVDYVTQAARGGIGNMPRIRRGEVNDAQMARIAAYLAKGKKR
jgi:cytochrome c553